MCRRKIAVFITESQQQAQLLQQQQQQLQTGVPSGDESTPSPSGSNSTTNITQVAPITGANSISCKEIVQFCKTRFGLTISLSTASRLRSSATERLATELLNPSAKRHRSVKFPEFEKALVQELRALEQEQLQIQQEQERLTAADGPPSAAASASAALAAFGDPSQLPPVMTLTSEAAITQVAKGIAERMGIPVTELGLTSGWYHGFKRRHGIKHRQFKSRSGANGNATGGLGSSLGSIGAAGAGDGSGSMMETGDGSDGPDGGDGDEEMEDVNQDSTETGDSKMLGEGSTEPTFKDQLNISNIVLTPKESAASSLSRRPEVKKVTAATANDALDVISEYLLQNGQIGATKLPLVKELRKFLLAQTELENGTSNNNNNSDLLLSVGVPVMAPVTDNRDSAAASVFVNSISISGSNAMGESEMVPLLEGNNNNNNNNNTSSSDNNSNSGANNASSLNLPADGLATMEEVLSNHQQHQGKDMEEQPQEQTAPQ
ncbi:hypothetical protein BGZ98_008197 [Dissophora globulifera]|nr:hypothetical protein BGZ98_008197 [Dissophora globulifera]